jgi:agmatinase
MDLREAYEGFTYSHASIFWNVLQRKGITQLTQVGIRDYCEAEALFAKELAGRVAVFFDQQLQEQAFQGISWQEQCTRIIATLPEKVYISFDIDALDPKLCPNTGTPVPGGLSLPQALYLIKQLVSGGRTIIGFDLNEVGGLGCTWDGNVGARVLYKLCNWLGRSNGRI